MTERASVVSTDGTRIHFEVQGAGDTVVLLHGLACDRNMWQPVAERLARCGRRVVTVDLRGHGDSPRVAGGYELDQLADDTRTVLAELDSRVETLVGHSAGGIQAIAFASSLQSSDPLLPANVVTICTSLSLDRFQERFVLAFSASPVFYGLLATPGIGPAVVRQGAFGSKPDRQTLQATLASARSCQLTVKRRWIKAIGGRNYAPFVDAVSTTVRLCTGERDSAFSIARLRASVPARAVLEIHGAGHMAPLEQPDTTVKAILGET